MNYKRYSFVFSRCHHWKWWGWRHISYSESVNAPQWFTHRFDYCWDTHFSQGWHASKSFTRVNWRAPYFTHNLTLISRTFTHNLVLISKSLTRLPITQNEFFDVCRLRKKSKHLPTSHVSNFQPRISRSDDHVTSWISCWMYSVRCFIHYSS